MSAKQRGSSSSAALLSSAGHRHALGIRRAGRRRGIRRGCAARRWRGQSAPRADRAKRSSCRSGPARSRSRQSDRAAPRRRTIVTSPKRLVRRPAETTPERSSTQSTPAPDSVGGRCRCKSVAEHHGYDRFGAEWSVVCGVDYSGDLVEVVGAVQAWGTRYPPGRARRSRCNREPLHRPLAGL